MPWWSGLGPEVIRELRARYPGLTLDRVAVEAMERPGYADEFKRLGAKINTYPGPGPFQAVIGPRPQPEDYPRVYFPSTTREACRDLVVAAMLDDSPAPEVDEFLGGLPYLKADYEAAGKLHKAGKMTVDGIEKRRELSTKRAYRIYRQFVAGAVLYDGVGLRPAPGYRWDPVELEKDPSEYKLIRA